MKATDTQDPVRAAIARAISAATDAGDHEAAERLIAAASGSPAPSAIGGALDAANLTVEEIRRRSHASAVEAALRTRYVWVRHGEPGYLILWQGRQSHGASAIAPSTLRFTRPERETDSPAGIASIVDPIVERRSNDLRSADAGVARIAGSGMAYTRDQIEAEIRSEARQPLALRRQAAYKCSGLHLGDVLGQGRGVVIRVAASADDPIPEGWETMAPIPAAELAELLSAAVPA